MKELHKTTLINIDLNLVFDDIQNYSNQVSSV